MPDVDRLNRNKEGILSAIRIRGPSLPVQVARAIGVPPLFASAFLSELKAENKLKISNMRVGSSPLYYISGQEHLLENFSEYLNQREREALLLLKNEQVLQDVNQEPVIRVALRAINDFAVPLRIRVGGESNLFWKYFLLDDGAAGELVRKSLAVKPEKKVVEEIVEKVEKAEVERKREIELEKEVEQKRETEQKERKPKVFESDFSKDVKDYLAGKDIEILEILSEKKREFVARVRIDDFFGKQVLHLIAKDKKSVSDNDLTLALQKAQGEKMPALFMSQGELTKKGREYLGEWGNLVKWEKLRF